MPASVRTPTSPTRVAALACAWFFGCTLADTHVPTPPDVDPVETYTSHPTVRLSGAAEPGSRIRVRRRPEIAAGQDLPLVDASQANCRFAVTVPLAPDTENTFELIAVASNGFASSPTGVTITRGPPRADGIRLLLADDRPRVLPGGATLQAVAVVAFSDGSSAERRPVSFRLSSPDGTQREFDAVSDDTGRAELTVPGLQVAGAGTLVAEVRQGNTRYGDTRAFAVVAGPPASATLELLPADGGLPVTTVPVGNWLAARVRTLDAGGNPVAARWALTSDPGRGAEIVGGALRFQSAGVFNVSATVATEGAPIVADARVEAVGNATAGAASIVVAEVPLQAVSGESMSYNVRVLDAAGRDVGGEVTLETDDPAVATAPVSGRVTLRRAGLTRLTFLARRTGDALRSRDYWVAVRAGAPATLAATLDGIEAPLPAGQANAAFVASPLQELRLDAAAADAAGNAVTPVVTVSTPPEVLRIGSTLVAPSRPGTYTAALSIDGTSIRTAVAFTVTAQPATRLALSCPATTTAGVTFTCEAGAFDAQVQRVSPTVSWRIEPAASGTVSDGRVRLDAAGNATVVAEVAGTAVRATRAVAVAPGPPASLAVAITNSPVQAGEQLRFATTVADAFGNALQVPLQVTTDAPGAVATADRLSNLGRSGTYSLVVRTTPTGATGGLERTAAFVVAAAAPARLRLSLEPRTIASGGSTRLVAALQDAYGNDAGTPSGIEFLVDGARPDQLATRLEGTRLSVSSTGTRVVTARFDGLSAEALLDVLPSPDTTSPAVSFDLPPLAANEAFRPGRTIQVTVRGFDDRGLAGLRLRVTGPRAGDVFDATEMHAAGSPDAVSAFDVPVPPATGTLSFTASATDLSGRTTTVPGSALVDVHSGAISVPAGTVRTVSIDPLLRRPTEVAAAAGGLWLRTQGDLGGGEGPDRLLWWSGGRIVERGVFTDFPTLQGLVAVSGVPHVFALNRGSAADVVMLRWPDGAPALQYATVPGLAATRPDGGPAGLTRHETSGITYAADQGSGADGAPRGRVFSFVPPATGVVDGPAVARVSLPSHTPLGLCVPPDGSLPTQVFMVARRTQGPDTFIGVYRLEGLSGGHVHAGATVTTHAEEPLGAAPGSIVYGACAIVPGPTSRIAFTRGVTETHAGTVVSLPLECTGPCPARTVLAAGTGALPLGRLTGLAWDGSGLVVTEPDAGRVFRLSEF